ncbi:JAB domain-containing protein [Pedobacter agri]|uniref:JAB domain-containing protein n=1 Tax=Pedobacter agri TaxID=454586 RepID=UPI00292E8C60|nr:JAB domain-containing protein [Pedobacter agri]
MVQNELFKIAEVSISYRPIVDMMTRPVVTSSESAFEIFRQSWDLGRISFLEEFKVLLLNRANKVLGVVNLSVGGVSGTVVDPKVLFVTALKANCSSVILCHNHPSGNLDPSEADFKLTKRLVECGKLLNILVWDHLIISDSSYLSFADEGFL